MLNKYFYPLLSLLNLPLIFDLYIRHALNVPAPPLPVVRSVAWTINAKNYKDILIRTYPTFAQILISPVTTGLKNSLNSNVCEELIDALRQVNAVQNFAVKSNM